MHLGIEQYAPYIEYALFIVSFMLAVLWRPVVGIFYLLPLIPLQTLRYRINDFPLGQSVIGVMLLGVVLGLARQGQSVLPRTRWTRLLCIYALFTFLSLCVGSVYLGRAFPFPGDVRFGEWQDYMSMPALLLLTAALRPTKRQMQGMLIVMCLATLAVDYSFWSLMSGRDLAVYRDELRDSGSMGYAGSNGLAAFEAQAVGFVLALAAFEGNLLLRAGYYVLAFSSAICLLYSFSRGGYLALLVGCLFLGLVKNRKLLVVPLLFIATGTTLLPTSVQQRILMSYDNQSGSLDHSAETRVMLWEDAMRAFDSNVVLGTGFDTYAYMHRVGNYEDTHNIYLKVLVETGVLGGLLFCWLIARTFGSGYLLFRRANDPFFASLGLGLATWVVCSIAANFFGDRWSFLQVNGYMWVLAGLVARAQDMESRSSEGDETVQNPTVVVKSDNLSEPGCVADTCVHPATGMEFAIASDLRREQLEWGRSQSHYHSGHIVLRGAKNCEHHQG